MEIISVNIQKGGSGKTTSVQAIAEILNRDYGKKVLCIDLDPQCNLTTVSGIDIMQYQDNNMYTLLKETATLQECIVQTKYYDIIPGSILLSYAETEFNKTGKEYFLKEEVDYFFKQMYTLGISAEDMSAMYREFSKKQK